jgi:hypothetical protein
VFNRAEPSSLPASDLSRHDPSTDLQLAPVKFLLGQAKMQSKLLKRSRFPARHNFISLDGARTPPTPHECRLLAPRKTFWEGSSSGASFRRRGRRRGRSQASRRGTLTVSPSTRSHAWRCARCARSGPAPHPHLSLERLILLESDSVPCSLTVRVAPCAIETVTAGSLSPVGREGPNAAGRRGRGSRKAGKSQRLQSGAPTENWPSP